MNRSIKFLFAFVFFVLISPANAVISPLTPQTAEYKVLYGNIELGKARFKLEKIDKLFQYNFDSDLSLLVLSDKRHVSSEFTVTDDHVNPIRYFHDREGTGRDYQAQLAFLKQQGNVYGRYKGDKSEFKYQDNLFDGLSVQMQLRLDLANKKEDLKYQIIKSNKISKYHFSVVGQEEVAIDQKTYQTIKLKVERKKKKRQTFIWLAPDLAYLPVKLSHSKKGKKQLEVQLLNSSFLTESDYLTQPKQTPITR